MDTISFVVEPDPRSSDRPTASPVIDILVNGGRLLALIEHASRAARDRTGIPYMKRRYGPCRVYAFPSPEQLIGEAAVRWPPAPWTPIYACGGCGEVGCDPVFVSIEVSPDRVRWVAWGTTGWNDVMHRKEYPALDWDLGPFEFDRAQYEAALASVETAQHRHAADG